MGAGLLAKAVGQSMVFKLNRRIREQARSHMGFVVFHQTPICTTFSASGSP